MKYTMQTGEIPPYDQIANLYDSVEWYAYTQDMKSLLHSLEHSSDLSTLWYDNQLIGLIRVLTDEKSILYIQDVLVHKDYQRQGIGTRLIQHMLNKYKDVRMKILMTDDTEETKGFYESLGFVDSDDMSLICFVKYENKA